MFVSFQARFDAFSIQKGESSYEKRKVCIALSCGSDALVLRVTRWRHETLDVFLPVECSGTSVERG